VEHAHVCLLRALFYFAFVYLAFTQLSDPVTLTATSVKKTRMGMPSAKPR